MADPRIQDILSDVAEQIVANERLTVNARPESTHPQRLQTSTLLSLPLTDANPRPDIPGYEIQAELGRGGMGVVYQARQVTLNRLVAIKLLNGRADPKSLIRFLAEAESSAAVDHPNVVRVYDYGEHAGQPYLALEYCPGGTLSNKLKNERLDLPEAAHLLEKIALGVAAAHRLGIVHRDLKPGNVLLDAAGEPKVADFGLAKRDTGADITKTDAVLGTPSYMSPEQAQGDTKFVGPQADVWSLGVMMYEMLTGERPFNGDSAVNVMFSVMQSEPILPRKLVVHLPKDLEQICLKCLNKSPRDRYDDAGALAADLGNWREGKPILARPLSSTQRVRRWCRKNPAIVGLLTLVAVSLLGGTIGMTAMYFRAEERREQAVVLQQKADDEAKRADALKIQADIQRDVAKGQAERARQVSRILMGMFNSKDPLGLNGVIFGLKSDVGNDAKNLELLDNAVTLLNADTTLSEPIKAEVYDAVGNVYRSIGAHQKAEVLLKDALKIRQELKASPIEIAASMHSLAWLYHERGEYITAESLYRGALKAYAENPDSNELIELNTRFNLAWILAEMSDLDGAEEMMKHVLVRRTALLGAEHRETALAHGGLASVYLEANQPVLAMEQINQMLAIFQKQNIDKAIIKGITQFMGAVVLDKLGDSKTAIKNLEEVRSILEAQLGPRHIYMTMPLAQIGIIKQSNKEYSEAIPYFIEALSIAREKVGLAHPRVLILLEHLTAIYRKLNQLDKATVLFEEVIEARRQKYGPDHVYVADALQAQAHHEFEVKNWVAERKLLNEAINIYEKNQTHLPRFYGSCLQSLAHSYYRERANTEAGKVAVGESIHWYRMALDINRKIHKKPNHQTVQASFDLFDAIHYLGKDASECERLLNECETWIPMIHESKQYQIELDIRSAQLSNWRNDYRKAAERLARYQSSGQLTRDQTREIGYGYISSLRSLSRDKQLALDERITTQLNYANSAVEWFRKAWLLNKNIRPRWYLNPPTELRGHAGFENLIAEVQQKYPLPKASTRELLPLPQVTK